MVVVVVVVEEVLLTACNKRQKIGKHRRGSEFKSETIGWLLGEAENVFS